MAFERIETVYRQLLATWNRRDAHAFAALFTEDGHAVAFDGSAMDGRVDIATTLSSVFQNERTGTYAASVREIREIAPGVTLLRAIVGMVPPDSDDVKLTIHATQSVVFLEREGDVRVVLLQSTPAAFHGRSEVAEVLTAEIKMILRSQRLKH